MSVTMLTLACLGWLCHGPVSPQVHHREKHEVREEDGARKRRQKKTEENGRTGLIDHCGEADGRG